MFDVIDLTKKLCAIPSVTGQEAAVVDYVAELMKKLNVNISRQQVDETRGRDNILILTEKQPKIILTTHLDTVPPHIDVSEDDSGQWLYGRGVCDAKGIAAAMICAFEQLLKQKIDDIGLLFLVGEETDSDGAKKAATGFMPKVKYFINGEPTDLKLAIASKGAFVFNLIAKGKEGHSAYPQTGKSALHQIITDLNRIITHEWPNDEVFGQTTTNIGCIEGGVAANVIAKDAQATGVMRTTKDFADLHEEMKNLISKETTLEVKTASSPMKFHNPGNFETCSVAFGTDIPHLSSRGIPLLIGPGSILDAHTDHEKVKKADLHKAVVLYKELVIGLQKTLS